MGASSSKKRETRNLHNEPYKTNNGSERDGVPAGQVGLTYASRGKAYDSYRGSMSDKDYRILPKDQYLKQFIVSQKQARKCRR